MSPNDQAVRLLGLVFAGADLVLEIDKEGRVAFALGALEALTGRALADVVGAPWTGLVAEEDADLLGSLLVNVAPGERIGPLRIGLAPRQPGQSARHASLSVFRLPERGTCLSCAISIGSHDGGEIRRTADGLIDAERFDAATVSVLSQAERAGAQVRLDLVEIAGFHAAAAKLGAPAEAAARRRVAAALRADSYAGVGASEVAPDRFALVRAAGGSGERLAERLQQATGMGVAPVVAELPLETGTSTQNAKAVRYALDRFIEDGPRAAAQGVMGAIKRMERDTTRFRTILADGGFHLAYQPVVDLKDESLHHYEALARFDGNASPADTIRLAEELDMIVDFDMAVAKGVIGKLATAGGDLRVAVNVSAISLMQPQFVEALTAATADAPDLRRRMLLEVTETQRLDDLAKADAIIAALRQAGHLVCLDDFGAGAASLDYLSQLTVDFVKLDGCFMQGLTADSREATVLKHITNLCRDLGVPTIAERVETRAEANLSRELGVDFGQGWAFGKPLPEPNYAAPVPVVAARRGGAVEQWG